MTRWALVMVAALVACGGKDEDTDAGSSLVDDCEELCAAQAQGEGCDTPAVEAECGSFCGFVAFAYASCEPEAEALYGCMAQQEYACEGVMSMNGVDMPMPVDPSACAAETTALSECAGTTTTFSTGTGVTTP